MRDIIFKGGKVQKGHRIKIPKAIMDTLDINEGQKIVIKFNVSKKTLTINLEE